MSKLIDALEAEARVLERATGSWRDADGKLYGLGPDTQKKWDALVELAAAYGYAPLADGDGMIGLYFNPQIAEERGIPQACWPESAVNVALGFDNEQLCPCCDSDPCVHADEVPDGWGEP